MKNKLKQPALCFVKNKQKNNNITIPISTNSCTDQYRVDNISADQYSRLALNVTSYVIFYTSLHICKTNIMLVPTQMNPNQNVSRADPAAVGVYC